MGDRVPGGGNEKRSPRLMAFFLADGSRVLVLCFSPRSMITMNKVGGWALLDVMLVMIPSSSQYFHAFLGGRVVGRNVQ